MNIIQAAGAVAASQAIRNGSNVPMGGAEWLQAFTIGLLIFYVTMTVGWWLLELSDGGGGTTLAECLRRQGRFVLFALSRIW